MTYWGCNLALSVTVTLYRHVLNLLEIRELAAMKRKLRSRIPPEQYTTNDIDKNKVVCNFSQSEMNFQFRQSHILSLLLNVSKLHHYNFKTCFYIFFYPLNKDTS